MNKRARGPGATAPGAGRRNLLASLLLPLLFAAAALAEPRPLGDEEIARALSGFTAIGTWDGRSYRQYFAADGRTLYQEEGAPLTTGRWKVENGRYCSDWTPPDLNGTSWGCYEVLLEGDRFYWRSQQRQESFRLEAGNRL